MSERLVEKKIKIGDKVRIKDIDWYNRYTNGTEVNCKYKFFPFSCYMKKYCSQIMTISAIGGDLYHMIEDNGLHAWTDDMFECKVEDEPKSSNTVYVDKAAEVFAEMLVELCPELLGFGGAAKEWENEFRKRLEE